MQHKNFMVLEMQKDGGIDLSHDTSKVFTEFDEAFEAFNNCIARSSTQLFKQPKNPQPLRASLENYDVELWIISRTDELIKN